MKLKLNGIEVDCIIGERRDERDRPQKLRVDVELEVDERVSESDDLCDAVDYAVLSERIRDLLKSAKCRMIERAAKLVHGLCIEDGKVHSASVTVTKYGAVTGLDSASATI